MPARILCVSGSTRPRCRTRHLLDIAAEAARQAGAEIKVFDLQESPLPTFREEEAWGSGDPVLARIRAEAAWAEGFLIATPEYHGNMSGALKNWFDFLYPELAGKTAGVMAVTGGGGGDMSIVAVKNSFQWCHGFVLPFHAAARAADFDGGGLKSDSVRDRLVRLGADIVRYAPLLHDAFLEARRARSGFAALP